MNLNRMKVLSELEIQNIYESALGILESTGVAVLDADVRKLLISHGARVDEDQKRVRFPNKLVKKCQSHYPNKVRIYNRDRSYFVTVGGGETLIAPGHNAVFFTEYNGSKRRSITKKDVGDFAIIGDALPVFDIVAIQGMPQDVLPRASLVHAFDAVIRNTIKPIYYSPETNIENNAIIELARVLVGDENLSEKPIICCQISSSSPLFWTEGAVRALIDTVNAGVPVTILSEPYTGVSAPITLAGIVTQNVVEFLSGMVISQLIKPGAPIIFGTAWTTFDMKRGTVQISSAEAAILRVCGVQMANFMNVPFHTITPDTDAHDFDMQNGWEKMLTTITSLSSGADLVVNSGMFSTGMSVSFSQLLIDAEIIEVVKRYIRGIEVNKDTIACEIIESVGPQGSFLAEMHTLKYLKEHKEHYEPKITNREVFDNWLNSGAKGVEKIACEKAQEILNTHKISQISSSVRQKLDEIIREFEKNIKAVS